MHFRHAFLVPLALALALPATAFGAWQPDGAVVSTAVQDQYEPKIVSDGSGGAIVTWTDYRGGTNSDIYAQRTDASGVVQWTADGVPLSTAALDQSTPTIVSDGSGGAIVTWQDFRSGTNLDIYAQRIDASGAVQWTADGVPLSTAGDSQYDPMIVSDGSGGAIVAWRDYRSGTNYDVYAQRINASGAVQWTADGVPLSTAANFQYLPTIVSDDSGGAIVTWQDYRSGTNYDIYAQRINASGAVQWTADGVPLSTAALDQSTPTIVSDDSGGAIVTWYDYRSGTNYDIYAQRINASGAVQWTANGVPLSIVGNNQYLPTIVSDDSGGAIVTWYDYRSGTNYDIYAQRINASGAVQWTANGVPLSTAALHQSTPTIVSDDSGGAIVTWYDYRSGTNYDIYAQRINASGAVQWTANGVPLSTAAADQYGPTIVSDGSGGAIVTWEDYRSGPPDIYAQRVEGQYGYWGHPEPIVASVADIPNDQGGRVAVNWKASGHDRPVPATIDFYSVWRAVDMAMIGAVAEAGAISSLAEVGLETPPGTTFAMSESPYYWELVGTQTAYRWNNYSFSAPTRADSLAVDPADEVFMVAAHDRTDEHIAFPSNAMGGHSVDNLSPAVPLELMAQRLGPDVRLRWDPVAVPDLRDYAVYRAGTPGVTPVPIHFLSAADDTVLIDAGAPLTALYYIVTAIDVHENESPASNEASVSVATGVGTPPPLAALTVLPNHPNPFAASTALEIGLAAAGDVEVGIYDAAGRRVTGRTLQGVPAGWLRVPFDGRDDRGRELPDGVYFYRVTAMGSTITRSMVITR